MPRAKFSARLFQSAEQGRIADFPDRGGLSVFSILHRPLGQHSMKLYKKQWLKRTMRKKAAARSAIQSPLHFPRKNDIRVSRFLTRESGFSDFQNALDRRRWVKQKKYRQ